MDACDSRAVSGLRIHGGLTRVLSPRKSFRLYFRREYGATQLPDDVLFDGRVDPIRRLVVHNDVREEATGRVWHFVNPLAYDITRRIGAYAPWTQPVRLFLNGEWRGVYILTEQVRDTMIPELLIPRFGHADFATDNRSYDELHAWVQRLDPLRMEAVAERVDLDNLTRWFLSVLFCATEDAFQGAQLLDRSRPAGGWFWINWDMDHAFMDYNRRAPVPWEHDTFSTTLERVAEAPRGWRESEVRATLLTTLLAEDEAYRDYFKRIFVEVMNHPPHNGVSQGTVRPLRDAWTTDGKGRRPRLSRPAGAIPGSTTGSAAGTRGGLPEHGAQRARAGARALATVGGRWMAGPCRTSSAATTFPT